MKKIFPMIALLCAYASLWAQDLKLPAIFSDNLVLQSGADTPVFGRAKPGATVQVRLAGKEEILTAKAVADKDGKWKAVFAKLPVGMSGELVVSCDGEIKTFKNAIVGEVWLCGGQSNMAWTIGSGTMPAKSKELAQKQARDADGKIRMFRVKQQGADTPQDFVLTRDPNIGWEVVTDQNVLQCTAIGWSFAADIFAATKRPMGIINSNWGGSPVEAWMPKEAIEASGEATAVWNRHEKDIDGWEAKMAAFKKNTAAFLEKYPTSAEQNAHRGARPKIPYNPEHHYVPTRLYNGMIHPLEPYGLAGALWYQGETNGDISRASEYGALITSMVKSWREGFGQKMPFYYVELANYMAPQQLPVDVPGKNNWAFVREQQEKVLAMPDTGVATAVDVGEAKDIHPRNKKAVADRLAGMALNDLYGKTSLCRSPQYADYKVMGDKVFVKLDYADGLRARGGEIKGFAIRGEDGEWVWADNVKILPEGIVEVASAEVKKPVAVRYGWSSNPVISLENKAGLPLRPFRTDKDSAQ